MVNMSVKLPTALRVNEKSFPVFQSKPSEREWMREAPCSQHLTALIFTLISLNTEVILKFIFVVNNSNNIEV